MLACPNRLVCQIKIVRGCLQHLGDEAVHVLLTVTTLATLVETLALDGLATLGRAELERPQEVVDLTEVRADSEDLVDDVLHAGDTILAKTLLDDSVVGERNALLVDLAEPTLVHEVSDGLQRWVAIGEVWLHAGEHLSGSLGRLHEHTHVHLAKTHDLEDLLGLCVGLSTASLAGRLGLGGRLGSSCCELLL